MKEEKECDFCKLIREKLDKKIPLFGEEITEWEDILRDGQKFETSDGELKIFSKFKPRNASSICRGFDLCSVHTRTIKKDNKFRLCKGEEIPNSLKILKKLSKADI